MNPKEMVERAEIVVRALKVADELQRAGAGGKISPGQIHAIVQKLQDAAKTEARVIAGI